MSVQTGQDEHLAKPAEGFTTLRELALSEAVPVRVRNVVESLCPDTEFLQLSPKEALARWTEVEDRLLLCHAFGVGSANALHAALRKAVAALGDEQNGQTLLNGNDSSKVQSLRDLATSNLAPIRIRGVFRKLRKDTLICKLSIDDAWANWGLVEEYLLQQRNFGQTSADELRQMVERACIETRQNCNTDSCQVADGTRAMDAPAESPLSGEPSRWLLGLMVSRDSAEWQSYADVVDGLTLADIAEEAPLFLTGAKPNWRGLVAEFLDRSARWIHTSETGLVSLTPVGHAHLRRWSLNANEKLTAEWLAVLFLIEKLAAYRSLLPMVVADTTYDDKKLLLRVSREGFLFRESKRRLVANSGVIAKLLTHFKTDPVNPPAPRLSSDLLIDLLLFDRNDRHKEVITARLCPASGCIRTLEETGQLFRVTRERIRQIVSNWEVAIAEDGRRDLAAQFVQDQEQTWIDDLEKAFASADIDRKATNDEIGSLLPPNCRLLLCASGLDPGKWVSQHTERANGTVYFVHASDTRIEEADVFLREVMEEQVDLPQLASHFFNLPDHFEETVHFTEAVRQGKLVAFSTPTGIVLSDNNSAHSRRLAFVISVFEEHPDWILSDQQLWNAICELSDTRAARGQWRVFSTSIRSAPCRYRRLPRIGWLDLIDCHTSQESRLDSRPLLTPQVAMGDRDRAMGDENQRGRLYALIAAQGGVYAKESIELWERHEGKGAGPSVGFLLDDPFFVISHPGMTSCLDDNGALVNAKVIRERLRNADGLQIYLKLRRSGFAPLDFPAWDERMLDMWSEWAEESVAHDVSSEIVARLQRDGVTCNGIRRGDTNAMDTCDDFGLLDSPRRPADSTIPAAEDIFQLVATAQRFGFLNWYLVNCCTGRHWYSHRAISWLAFLVACGALEACGHWQERHGLTTTGRSMLRALVGCARQHESLTWSANESCQRIIERCADTWQQNIEGSWVSRVEFSRLLSAMLDPIRREGPATLNADVFKLSTSRSLLPRKSSAHASQYVDPFLRDLLG